MAAIPKREPLMSPFLRLIWLCLPLWAAAQTAPQPGPSIAIGGALKHDNLPVWSRIVQEAGGAGSRFLVFPTASGNPQRTGERIAASLTRAGASVEVVPLTPSLAGSPWEAVREDAAWIAKIDAAQGVFFSGGAQELITRALQPEGKPTRMLQAIRALQARGGVVAGTSAGAAMQSSWMFRDAQDALAVLKGRLREGQEFDRGLGFVGPELFIDQHFLKRGRIARLLPILHARGYRYGLGVEEDSAAIIRGEGASMRIEVIGARGALLVDLGEAQVSVNPFRVRNAVITYLDRGDRHGLASGVTEPSEAKRAGLAIEPFAKEFKPNYKRALVSADILGDNTIAHAMAQLLDSPDLEARSLAFNLRSVLNRKETAGDGGLDPDPTLGFEFRLHKAPDTRGQFTAVWGGEDYSVQRMRLDITPVRLQTPLFQVIQP
jgi:cyanophycinase